MGGLTFFALMSAMTGGNQAADAGLPRTHQSQGERELMEADLEFASDAKKRGVAAAFADRYHPDGKLIGPGAPVLVGPEAVRAALADDRSNWSWAPEEAAQAGDLGVTWGHATITYADAAGRPASVKTRYVTVWRRDSSSTWKIWIDIGNRAPAEH